ncbi:MAG TPA: hypothetical protein PKO22_02570 [Treponemataceae bacterium]|nr:hypothetical protein [Treponemataceae bacterium]
MKKTIMFLTMAIIVGAGLFAQADGRGPKNPPAPAPNAAQIEPATQASGNLAYVNGWIALQSGDKTYYLAGIQRLIGFVDGLKEGAAVKVEGYVRAMPMAPEYSFMRVTKVTVGGKSYDIPAMPRGEGPGMGKGNRRCGDDDRDFGDCRRGDDDDDDRDNRGNGRRGRMGRN